MSFQHSIEKHPILHSQDYSVIFLCTYMPLFTLVLPLRTLFCSDQNEPTRFLRLIVIKSWIKQVKSVWLLFLDPLKIQYFVMSMFLTGELHAEAWTRFLYQHTDPWLCSHLVFGHCCLGADTKQCCVQTLGTPSTQVPFSPRVQRQDLRALILCSNSEHRALALSRWP